MSPSASTGCIGKRNPAAQPSATGALALTAAAKGALKMMLRMMVKNLDVWSNFYADFLSSPAGGQGVRDCTAAWSTSVMLTILLLLSSS